VGSRARQGDVPIPPSRKTVGIAILSIGSIVVHLVLRFLMNAKGASDLPLYLALLLGGTPLVLELLGKLRRREVGSDLLAGISIVTCVLLGEYLAGTIVVLMLSGGAVLETYAIGRASSVLQALARRAPSRAHRRRGSELDEVPLSEVRIGDTLTVFPHEICPVDGVVLEGHGVMDESYLTGEPFQISKAPGARVLSGAINGDHALTFRALRVAADSRHARIMNVVRDTEQRRPRLRRLGDQLGAVYTPIALALATGAWIASGHPRVFLAVMVIATPCPLLIAIPTAIIGSVSLAARRSIVIRNPAILEQIGTCRTIVLDKTGTLTYGRPKLTDQICAPGVQPTDLLVYVASLEQYSKHPLAGAVLDAARASELTLAEASEMSETPGSGLCGRVLGHDVRITGRDKLKSLGHVFPLPPVAPGLECVILLDGRYAGVYRFHDEPRDDSRSFVGHLRPKHRFDRILLVSGDRQTEVRYLAEKVGIDHIFAGRSPEEKAAIVAAETRRARTLFVGDGINDAPALMAATVGVAFGLNSDVTTEAAGAVIMDSAIERIDELFHIGRRLRQIALQSAVGGIALSMGGMLLAASGRLTPVVGALVQEVIDLLAILNALRVALPPKALSDFKGAGARVARAGRATPVEGEIGLRVSHRA